MNNLLDHLLTNFRKIKKSEYSELETTLIRLTEKVLPKKSKTLSTNFFKKIFTESDNLILILLGHLYIEKLLNEILITRFKVSDLDNKNGKLNTFYKKTLFLNNQLVIEENLAEDILLISNLRNHFAHELNYKLSDFNFWKLSKLKDIRKEDLEPKLRKTKEIFIRMIIKIYLLDIYISLTNKFRFLHLVDEK